MLLIHFFLSHIENVDSKQIYFHEYSIILLNYRIIQLRYFAPHAICTLELFKQAQSILVFNERNSSHISFTRMKDPKFIPFDITKR